MIQRLEDFSHCRTAGTEWISSTVLDDDGECLFFIEVFVRTHRSGLWRRLGAAYVDDISGLAALEPSVQPWVAVAADVGQFPAPIQPATHVPTNPLVNTGLCARSAHPALGLIQRVLGARVGGFLLGGKRCPRNG